MKSSAVLLFSALVFGSVANATLAPLPGGIGSAYIGNNITVTAGSWISGSQQLNGGGAFDSFVSPASQTSVNTAFWCVDDQTNFSIGATGQANLTLLSDLSNPTALNNTWYATATPGFTDQSGTLAGADVQNRLVMAAYLVQQYGGFSPYTTISGSPSHSTYTNTDIQDAIWTLMNNAAFNSHPGSASAYYNPGDAGVNFWLNDAAANYRSVDINSWALVTWATPANPYQTFLVNVSGNTIETLLPEPGFYGALALGMSGLALMITRKRKLS